MKTTLLLPPEAEHHSLFVSADATRAVPYAQQTVTISKQEYIRLIHERNYWQAQHAQAKQKIARLEQENLRKAGKIRDLQHRVFGKTSEKTSRKRLEKGSSADNGNSSNPRSRGQQPGAQGHGRTDRPDLPMVDEVKDLADTQKTCPSCGLPHQRNPALDEYSHVIEVEVNAHIRRIKRPAYTRNQDCCCENTPTIITAAPPPRLIPRSDYGVSFWVEVILGKYRYHQPNNRHLTDLGDQGLPVSPGTLCGGLQKLIPLFEPIQEALYCQQMSEPLFHNDETRWEVFVEMEGKIGSRWYLWVTRSSSVIYYCIDPSRSAAVPGAHFAGLQQDRVIIVCDRYSAYKKLARLSDIILLAFCWAHVRRDFLNAAKSFKALEPWALDWKQQIGQLYHLNKLRLQQWNADLPILAQSPDFHRHHQALETQLQIMQAQAQQEVTRVEQDNISAGRKRTSLVGVTGSAQKQRIKIYRSLLTHWQGLTLFMQNPQIPLDNNLAENSIRGPVTGRSAYYGSGSIWSAELAAMLFSILQTLVLWHINPRHWLRCYLDACAENGGKAPANHQSFIPWQMDAPRRESMSCSPPLGRSELS
jgi:transposase